MDEDPLQGGHYRNHRLPKLVDSHIKNFSYNFGITPTFAQVELSKTQKWKAFSDNNQKQMLEEELKSSKRQKQCEFPSIHRSEICQLSQKTDEIAE